MSSVTDPNDRMNAYIIEDASIVADLCRDGFVCEDVSDEAVSFSLNPHAVPPATRAKWYKTDCPFSGRYRRPPHVPMHTFADGSAILVIGTLIWRKDVYEKWMEGERQRIQGWWDRKGTRERGII